MKPAAFEYHRPSDLDEALSCLARLGPRAKVLAGGQSLVPMLNLRLAQAAHLVDLNDLIEWQFMRQSDRGLEIGFLTRHVQVADSALVRSVCPLMSRVVGTIGHDAIRHRGTMGGSLANADPAAQWVLLAMTLEAEVQLRGPSGERTLKAEDFLLSAMSTSLRPDELLVQARWPVAGPSETAAYEMFNRRHGDYAVAAVAMTLRMAQGRVQALRIGVAGLSEMPVRMRDAERQYLGAEPDQAWQAALADAVATGVTPAPDARLPAAYRRDLVRELTRRCLRTCLSSQEIHA
jgi:carbon-monoxide dehydrogenase medium subunit